MKWYDFDWKLDFLAIILRSLAPWSIPKLKIPIKASKFWVQIDPKKQKITENRLIPKKKEKYFGAVNELVSNFNWK